MARARRLPDRGPNARMKAMMDKIGVTEAGQIGIVELADCQIDQSYQRDASQRQVDLIAASWDLDLAGVLEINIRTSGEVFVIDGQARMLAAHVVGEEALFAKVHIGLTPEQEAARFRDLNKLRRQIKSLEDFKAALRQDDPMACEVRDIVVKCGGYVGERQAEAMGGAIIAVAALQAVYRGRDPYDGQGSERLKRCLTVMRDAYGPLKHEFAQGDVIKGVSAFIERFANGGRNPDYKRAHLVKRMQEIGFRTLMEQAASLRNVYGGSLWTNIARSLVPVYNHGLRQEDRLPDFDAKRES